jgi:hypothetical protein
MNGFEDKLQKARELSWANLGKEITFYLPGMFSYNGLRGAYPGVSITGSRCELMCDHCQAKILESMPPTVSADALIDTCKQYADRGCVGVLISGGCDRNGRLPWEHFTSAIRRVKQETGLYTSIHCGLLDLETATALKEAGVDQALLDVIGDDDTYRTVYHVDFGISRIQSTLHALNQAGLPVVPHVICGLHRGKMKAEKNALEIIAGFDIEQLVVVSLMALRGTPFEKVETPGAREIAEIIAEARHMMPRVRMSLGCARNRGDEHTELLALESGINRMALPSDAAVERAGELGLTVRYQRTCCSVEADFSRECW